MGLAHVRSVTKRVPGGRPRRPPSTRPAIGSGGEGAKSKVSSPLTLRWLRDEASATERRRLVQELHDGPLRAATAAKIHLQARRRFAHDPQAAAALDEAILLIRQVITSMRQVLRGRVNRLGAGSLRTHLRRAIARWSEMTGMRVDLTISGNAWDDAAVFSPESLAVAEHVVGESIVNAWIHGHATQVSVSCRPHNGGMLLTLRDDGSGLRPAADARHPNGTKLGLRLLRSRIRELGGWLHVRSPQSGGAIVETWIPGLKKPLGGSA